MVYIALFLLLLMLVVFAAGYFRNRTYFNSNGGFAISPLPFAVLNYLLIFVYRPFAIQVFDAPTLDGEEITSSAIVFASIAGLLSLIAAGLPYLASLVSWQNKIRTRKGSGKHSFCCNKITLFLLICSILVCLGLLVYGSAVNNVTERAKNIESYNAYFLYVISQRFHFVASVVGIYVVIKKREERNNFLKCLLIVAPFLAFFAAGRSALFYIIISYGLAFAFAKPIRVNSNVLMLVFIVGACMFFLNYILATARIILISDGWNATDLIDLFSLEGHLESVSNSLVLASWDYCVYDTFVRIANESSDLLYGWTNATYFLALIPRFFWQSKPLDMGFMPYVTSTYYNHVFQENGSTFTGTIVGEGFLNFGIIGIVAYSLIFSWIMLWVYMRSCSVEGYRWPIIYAMIFPFAQQFIRSGLDTMVNCALLVVIPYFVIEFLCRKQSCGTFLYKKNIPKLDIQSVE